MREELKKVLEQLEKEKQTIQRLITFTAFDSQDRRDLVTVTSGLTQAENAIKKILRRNRPLIEVFTEV